MDNSPLSSKASFQLQNSLGSSGEDIQEQRKRKRMISNRESARRSRMRKQKYLDEMMAQLNQLRNDNNQLLTNINIVYQLYENSEAENSVLRAQISELTHRLESLNEIIMNCMNFGGDVDDMIGGSGPGVLEHQEWSNPLFDLVALRNKKQNQTLIVRSPTPTSNNAQNSAKVFDHHHHEINEFQDNFFGAWNMINNQAIMVSSADGFMY